MRLKHFAQSFVVVMLIPWLFCRGLESQILKDRPQPHIALETEPIEIEPSVLTEEIQIPVLLGDGQIEEMSLESYLCGVVLGEMPASFAPEALKAQAVVARTYTLKRHTNNPKHDCNAVCTDPACCQAYCTQEDYLAAGHTQQDLQKVAQAVEQTCPQVLTYEGELIDATYFSCSGGRTEAAVAVWGRNVPYLQSVDSPGEESARVYLQEEIFDRDTLSAMLGVCLETPPESWFSGITYTDGGGVETATVGGTVFSGTQLRALLGLRSTAFTVTAGEDSITVTTRGYGHRVGMSQYGAQAMAESGSTYREILSHYYPGTTLENRTA